MGRRSLQASSAGIDAIKKALKRKKWSQTYIAGAVGCSRQTIWSLLQGNPTDCDVFMKVCDELSVNWEELVEPDVPEELEQNTQSTIDDLVQEIREEMRSLVTERCGEMRVLDMTQPIKLTGEQGIYTNVNILEKITARNRREIAQLLQNTELEEFEFNRFGLSGVREERVAGIEAVKRHNKLMVLGKPGAGKTTFLKYLAMQCIEGHFLGDRVPLFITLKDFAETKNQPDFLDYIREKITNNATESQIQNLIQQGKAFVLLDGLDEVREEDTGRVLREIRDFSDRYADNHFVITCRIAAKEYVFERFTEVEVADFNEKQISTFVHNWFRCKDPAKGEEFAERIIEKLDENEPIKELASNPLLLTLLCLECEESLEFPKNRAELYERGLRVLLSKWDASRKIQRDQFYEKLSINRKEDLLSQLALKTFEQKDYFFKQRTVEHHIADYIINLPDARTDPNALQLDSEAALRSIEAQHGLLVERARGIYSFSHLTFQEYFTAKQIVNDANYERLVEHLTEKRWREVFLLTANIMPKADRLLLLMKQVIDKLLEEQKLQQFLEWIHKKAQSLKIWHSLTARRAFYFELDPNNYFCGLFDVLDDRYMFWLEEFDFLLDRDLVQILRGMRDLTFQADHDFARILYHEQAEGLDYELHLKLLDLERQLPQSWNDIDAYEKWWETGSQAWAEQLRTIMIEHRNIGHDWQFSKEQKDLLQQYYDANKLLVDCLNSDCYVSRDVRQEIEEALLLPMAEIERRKKGLHEIKPFSFWAF